MRSHVVLVKRPQNQCSRYEITQPSDELFWRTLSLDWAELQLNHNRNIKVFADQHKRTPLSKINDFILNIKDFLLLRTD